MSRRTLVSRLFVSLIWEMNLVTAPKFATLTFFIGLLGLPVSALMGVSTAADYVLDAVEILFALAAILIIGHVVVGIVLDARALETTSR